MNNTEKLKQYLLEESNAFLFSSNNVGDVDKKTYEKITKFIKTGIVLQRLTHEL